MRLARNEVKIAVFALCLLVLFGAIYLVIKLTGDEGRQVAERGDARESADTTAGEVDETSPALPGGLEADLAANDPDDGAYTPPIMEDDAAVDPFEAEPQMAASEAGDAWDRLFANSDTGTLLMETPGADGTGPAVPTQDEPAEDDTTETTPSFSDGADVPDYSGAAPDAPPSASTAATTARTYTIRAGDSFYTIARDQLGDASLFKAIEQANPLVDPRRLRVGMEIKLPSAEEIDAGTRGTPSDAGSATLSVGPNQHVVQAGETLSDIAQQHYGKAHLWNDIHAANRDQLGNTPNRLRVGMVLTIPPLAE